MPGGDREDVRVEDDVLRVEADRSVSSRYARAQISTLRSTVSAWPGLVEGHHHHPAP